jgi:hypothetical protein
MEDNRTQKDESKKKSLTCFSFSDVNKKKVIESSKVRLVKVQDKEQTGKISNECT